MQNVSRNPQKPLKMEASRKHKPFMPIHSNANLGTFPFFQPRQAATIKNGKEPKFINHTSTSKFVLNFKSFR
jgi:hypothetical protein